MPPNFNNVFDGSRFKSMLRSFGNISTTGKPLNINPETEIETGINNIPQSTNQMVNNTFEKAGFTREEIDKIDPSLNKTKKQNLWKDYVSGNTYTDKDGEHKGRGQGVFAGSFNFAKDKISGMLSNLSTELKLQIGSNMLSITDSALDSGLLGYGASDYSLGERNLFGGINAASLIGGMIDPKLGAGIAAAGTALKIVDGIGARKLDTFKADKDVLATVGSDYSAGVGEIMKGESISGKKIGLFGNYGKMKNLLERAKLRLAQMSDISAAYKDLQAIVTGNSDLQSLNYQLKVQGVNFLTGNAATSSYKEGGKIDFEIEEIPHWEFIEVSNIESFKNGGEFNVIPDGSLHARKHNMDIDGITKKGIPVISEEDGEIVQHAEIEKNEIILRKYVTEKLEKWKNTFYNEESKKKDKDEACLKAGKLLVEEILNNTLDNTGILNGST